MVARDTAQKSPIAKIFDGERLVALADGLAIALVMSLPWSTSATGILATLWLLIVLPTVRAVDMKRVLSMPAGGVPVLLFFLGVIGMTWADVPYAERMRGIGSFAKLLVIPMLMVHFRHSDAAKRVMMGFLISCLVLLALSWTIYLAPKLGWWVKYPGVPVKNYASQADMFTIAIFILAAIAHQIWRTGTHRAAVSIVVVVLAFLSNILYIATSRTAFVAVTILFAVFGLRKFDWKAAIGLVVLLGLIGAAVWSSSFYLRLRIGSFADEINQYRTHNARSSAGERVEFWKKSIGFIVAAPVIGHGTGSIADQFRRAVSGERGASAVASENPHNQTLAVGIQLGLVGTTTLFAMWFAHLMLFRGGGLAAWIGLVIVIQDIVGSLFNSNLFDFTQGWAYVIGVGVAGGTLMRSCSQTGGLPTEKT